MNQSIETLFDDLRSNSVKCLMIRPKALHDTSLFVGDIDMLISPDAYLNFLLCVKNICRKDGLSFYVKRKKHSKLELTIFDLSSDLTVMFDLWFYLDVRYGKNKKYISWETLIDKHAIIEESGRFSLEKDFSALFYISHLYSKKKDLSNKEVQARVTYFLNTEPSEKICLYLQNLNEDTYSKVYDYFLKQGYYDGTTASLTRKLMFKLSSVGQFSNACVVGPDGVGKGTIIELLLERTASKYYRFKKTFRKSLLYILQHSLLRNKKDSKNVFDEKNRKNLFWFSLSRSYLVMLFNFGRKRLIFDRYFYDLMINGLRSESIKMEKGDDFESKLKWAPKLKTVIQLDAPANVIRERKAELPDDKVDALSCLYLECAVSSHPKEFLYLNTDQSLDNIKDFLEKLINERNFLKR